MTAEQIKELLEARALSSSDKRAIEEAYTAAFNRPLVVKTKCRDCYNDALHELLSTFRTGKRLAPGYVIKHEGQTYTAISENLPQSLIDAHKEKLI